MFLHQSPRCFYPCPLMKVKYTSCNVVFTLQKVFICNYQPQHSQQNSTIENCREHVQHTWLSSIYLFCCLHFPIAVQEVALNDRAHNGQAFSRLQLWGKCEQSGIFYMEVLIQLQQHQQLRSVVQWVVSNRQTIWDRPSSKVSLIHYKWWILY